MSQILQLFVIIPLLAFLVSLLIPRNKEKIISWLATGTTGIHLAGCGFIEIKIDKKFKLR